jgi:thiol-disulfide isomerase/thioredoxin
MATICFLATLTVGSVSYGQYNQLGGSGNGAVNHNQQSPNFGWVPPSELTPNTESSPVRLDEETEYHKSLRRAYNGRLDRRSPQGVYERDESSSPIGAKDFTPKRIKDQGNENKNYVVMISASWCAPCKKMYPHMLDLREQGYIIYIFDTTQTEFEDYAALYAIDAYPTFIVYDKGKEVRRSEGLTNKTWFKKHLKLKKDQKDEEPDVEPSNPYDGL